MKKMYLTREQIDKLEQQDYSCGDCERLDNCRRLGVTAFSFICSRFEHPNARLVKNKK